MCEFFFFGHAKFRSEVSGRSKGKNYFQTREKFKEGLIVLNK
jgi:hypothetical protein